MISLTMPPDVRQHVLDIQGKKKCSAGLGHYSQQQAIYAIIREHKEFTDVSQRTSKEPERGKTELP